MMDPIYSCVRRRTDWCACLPGGFVYEISRVVCTRLNGLFASVCKCSSAQYVVIHLEQEKTTLPTVNSRHIIPSGCYEFYKTQRKKRSLFFRTTWFVSRHATVSRSQGMRRKNYTEDTSSTIFIWSFFWNTSEENPYEKHTIFYEIFL